MNYKEIISKYKYRILFFAILLLATVTRLYQLGTVPGGVHADEAFAGYEAYSIIHYGTDSWGYKLPVYFVSWGSGMNVLESYLMIPFVSLFGLNEITIRIPQVLFAIISIVYMYLLVKKVSNEKMALTAMFIISISPWHFMFSRWGCESNMCSAMLLIGTYYLVLSIDRIINKNKSPLSTMILSAIFFGLDLYCYAATWILVVAILVTWVTYVFVYLRKNDIKMESSGIKSIIAFSAILAFMALPLVLFILVNLGIIPEIKSFISIPKMVVFRNDEVMNFSVLKGRLRYFAHILVAQEDGRPWNTILPYGLFYTKISIPIIFVGIWRILVKIKEDFKNSKFSYSFMLFTYSIIATVLVIVQRVDIISSNYLQICILFYWGAGIYYFSKFIKGIIFNAMIIAYVVIFGLFLNTYFGSFKESINETQLYGAREAILNASKYVDENMASSVHLCEQISHANLLFYTKYPVDEYISSVEWKVYPDRYLSAKTIGIFTWEDYEEVSDKTIYIIGEDEVSDFKELGWTVEEYNDAYLAICK